MTFGRKLLYKYTCPFAHALTIFIYFMLLELVVGPPGSGKVHNSNGLQKACFIYYSFFGLSQLIAMACNNS